MFIRWLTPEEAKVAPPIQHPLDPIIEAGPPDEAPGVTDTSPQPDPDPRQPDLEQMIAAKERYEAAIKRREAEIVAEKLAAASKAFAKSIA